MPDNSTNYIFVCGNVLLKIINKYRKKNQVK